MKSSSQKKSGLKVRADVSRTGAFELKGADGSSLGFILNGDGKGPSFVIAGSGAVTRSVYQQVMTWPATKVILGRLALILIDKVDGENATAALREVTELLSPVKDTLFLPPVRTEHPRANQTALQTIENFCNIHGLLSVKASKPDCASL